MTRTSFVSFTISLAFGLGAVACSQGGDSEPDTGVGSLGTALSGGAFEITSPSFLDEADFPDQFTCEGQPFGSGYSPELNWTKGPKGTHSYAIVLLDLSLIDGPIPDRAYHWAIWDIPQSTYSLPENLPRGVLTLDRLEDVKQARPGAITDAYFGPCPSWADLCDNPQGRSNEYYTFRIYAIDSHEADVPPAPAPPASYVHVLADYFESVALAHADLNFYTDARPSSIPFPTNAGPCAF